VLNLLSCSILLEIEKGLFFVLAVRGLLSDMALCVCVCVCVCACVFLFIL